MGDSHSDGLAVGATLSEAKPEQWLSRGLLTGVLLTQLQSSFPNLQHNQRLRDSSMGGPFQRCQHVWLTSASPRFLDTLIRARVKGWSDAE